MDTFFYIKGILVPLYKEGGVDITTIIFLIYIFVKFKTSSYNN